MTTSTVFKQKIDSSPDRSTFVVGGPSLVVEPALRMGARFSLVMMSAAVISTFKD
jgi:hypothetical protein